MPSRLADDERRVCDWKRWGPYLAERQWGTVREDYSADGGCWTYFPHDHARSRAYRWGEDGLLGITDRECRLCFALALWNGRDPILKERLFGLTEPEGNHGEDVKECYFYLDATPTALLPEGALQVSAGRVPLRPAASRRTAGAAGTDPEFELLDTGVFDDDRYFDVFAEYAKASPNDILIRITVGQSRAGGRDAAPAADALVSQHLVLGLHARRLRAASRGSRRTGDGTVLCRARDAWAGSVWRPGRPSARPPVDCSSPTTRPTTQRLFGRPPTKRPTSRTPFTITSSTAGRTPSIRRPSAPRPRPHYRLQHRRGGRGDRCGFACIAEDEAPARAFRRRLRRRLRRADREADEFYATKLSPALIGRRTPRRAARPMPACSGPSSSTTTWSRTGSRAIPTSRRRPPSRRHGRNRDWPHLYQPRRDLDARQVGVPLVRRLGPRPST